MLVELAAHALHQIRGVDNGLFPGSGFSWGPDEECTDAVMEIYKRPRAVVKQPSYRAPAGY
jgi:hypothetical protein